MPDLVDCPGCLSGDIHYVGDVMHCLLCDKIHYTDTGTPSKVDPVEAAAYRLTGPRGWIDAGGTGIPWYALMDS